MKKNKYKIAIVGDYNSGKTTLVHYLDCTARSVEADQTTGITTTVAIDFGRIGLDGCDVYLFGTPGQERFAMTRSVASYGADGIIVVVDSTKGMTEQEAQMTDGIADTGIPFIIALNKLDVNPSARRVIYNPDLIGLVYPMSAVTGEGVLQGVRALLKKIDNMRDKDT